MVIQMMHDDVLLTFKEAMGYLRVSRSTLYRLMWSGQLIGHKVGSTWRFYREDLRACVGAGREASIGMSSWDVISCRSADIRVYIRQLAIPAFWLRRTSSIRFRRIFFKQYRLRVNGVLVVWNLQESSSCVWKPEMCSGSHRLWFQLAPRSTKSLLI